MQVDAHLLFSSAQAVTANAASTSFVDLKAVRNAGVGRQLFVVCVCTVAMTDAGSNSGLDVHLYGDSTTTFTPDYSRKLFTFPAVSAAGTKRVAPLGDLDLNLQYVELFYLNDGGGDLSTGSFTAFITDSPDQYASYPDAITVS